MSLNEKMRFESDSEGNNEKLVLNQENIILKILKEYKSKINELYPFMIMSTKQAIIKYSIMN